MFFVIAVNLLFSSLLFQSVSGYQALMTYFQQAKVDTWLIEGEMNWQNSGHRELILKSGKEYSECFKINNPEVRELAKFFDKKTVTGFLSKDALPIIVSGNQLDPRNSGKSLGIMFYPKIVENHPRLGGFKFYYSQRVKSVVIPLIRIDPSFKCAMFLRVISYAQYDFISLNFREVSPIFNVKTRNLELNVLNLKTGGRFLAEADKIAAGKKAASIDQLWDKIEFRDLVRLDSMFNPADLTEAAYRVPLFTYAIGQQWEYRKSVGGRAKLKDKDIYQELLDFLKRPKRQ